MDDDSVTILIAIAYFSGVGTVVTVAAMAGTLFSNVKSLIS